MITNDQVNLTLEQHYNLGVEKKEIRSYEVSLWTLQDSFITVLKWSDVEQKGRIQHPKMILDVDGTQEFTCSIPMYYRRDGILVENPNWYNTRNGNLIEGLRKIKVIFNKGNSTKEAVFEFVILNVNEVHENDILTCEIKCEGLAFHELGKIGYKIDLSPEGFYLTYKDWAEKDGNSATEPIQDLDYWCGQAGLELLPTEGFINPSRWYYTVQMNQKSFENAALSRKSNKIYEETYTTAWDENLNPIASKTYAIKARPVEIKNSNVYNITQTIAETFGVFCRYEYLHDANYHIIARIIVFYNNYFQEDEGYFSLTYPYSAERVSRTMDSTDVTTKLYVLNVDDDNTLLGYHSIMDSEANKTKEDYILNFDYLHNIGAITEEQYAAITTYEKNMRELNEALIPLQQNLATQQVKLPELKAKVTLYENSKKLDQEQIDSNMAKQNALDTRDKEEDGYISITNKNPDSSIINEDSLKGNYADLNTNKGIVASTLKVYMTWSSSTQELSNEITNWTPVYDDYGNLIRIKNLSKPNTNRNRVYMTYKYDPQLYYQTIIDSWREKLGNDEANYNEYAAQLGEEGVDEDSSSGIYKLIKQIEKKIADKTAEKNNLIKKFNEMMGPALREGYWQPESYSDYGEQKVYTENLSLSYSNDWKIEDTEQSAVIGWDNELFDGEQKSSYEYGVNQTLKYYPCIDLSNIYNNLSGDITQYSFYFNNNYTGAAESGSFDWRYQQAYAVGSQAILSFAKETNGSEITPILILAGARSLTDDQITRMKSTGRFGQITTSVGSNGTVSVSVADNSHTISWLDMSNYEVVMPRIKFSSLELKTQGNDLIIKYNNQLLKQFEDFYINTRNTERNETYYQEYFITIKPTTLLKTKTLSGAFDINYILSNANTAIYLDALEVSHENAYPKVSYEISTNILNINIINTLYARLAQLVMINDTDLKFENTFGYISHLDLDLDSPQNDEIEIKNYKTKFEDLFSTIVAQTEQMKRAQPGISAALSGSASLSSEGFTNTINNNYAILDAYLDSHFDSSEVVQNKLTELFTEAGQILADSANSVNKMSILAVENAGILSNFAQNISRELAGQVYRQQDQPISFKIGDIWIELDNSGNEVARYVATYNSSETNGTGGWVQTSDGTLAQIKGASLNLNAEEGIVTIEAEKILSLRSKGLLNLEGNDVNITGEQSVNIGGPSINLGAATGNGTPSSINLIATAYTEVGNNTETTSYSKVLINPNKIELGSADILMRGANKIQMVTSRGTSANTSAIEISPDTGVWIGSGQGVRLFSSGFSYNVSTNTLTKTAATGASVELNSEHLILGYANTISNNATAIEMNDQFVIIAAGSQLSGNTNTDASLNVTGTTGSLIGAKFTKNSIGFATGSGANINAILMNDKGITIGSGSINVNSSTTSLRATTGSYVRIASDGIDIGSLANLYINSNNFKLQTDTYDSAGQKTSLGSTIFAVGTNLNNINKDTQINTLNQNSTVNFLLNQYGAFIKGTIYASAGSFSGDVRANTFTAISNKGKLIASGDNFGFYSSTDNAILTIDSNGNISANGGLTISSGKTLTLAGASLIINTTSNNTTMTLNSDGITIGSSGSLDIGATNFLLDSDATGTNNILRLGTDQNPALSYSLTNGLSITGNVTATSFTVTGSTSGISYNDLSDKPTIPDPSTFTIDGLSYIQGWPGDGKNYVSLTSTGGLLIGANNGIIIPSAANSAVNPYLLINEDGIELNGKHIKINGKQEWSRDDIIIMKNNPTNPWEDSVEHIEAYMKNETVTIGGQSYQRGSAMTDWVLIKPYYNGEFEYTGSILSGSSGQQTMESTIVLFQTSYSDAQAFGTVTTYHYTFSVLCKTNQTNGTNVTANLTLTASDADGKSVSQNTGDFTIGNSWTWKTVTIDSSVNLLSSTSSGRYVQLAVVNNGTGKRCMVNQGKIIVTCDTTTSRVPCTVYYYP